MTATDSTGRPHTQAAQIGPREYVVTPWAEADGEKPADLEAVIGEVLARKPTALLLDLRAFMTLGPAIVDAIAASLRPLREARVFVVLVADWRELSCVAGADGLDRFVAIRPTLASAIEAVRGRSA